MPSNDDERLTDREVKRLLELALSKQERPSGRLSLGELKAGAEELGVGRDRLDQAFVALRAEQVARGRRRSRAAIAAAALLAGAVVVAFVVRQSAPRPFDGSVHVTLTSAVKDNRPVDTLGKVRILSNRTLVIYTTMSGLERQHKMRCDLVDPSGNVLETDAVQLQSTSEPYYVWYVMHVQWEWPVGQYRARIYADDKLVSDTPVDVERGQITLHLTSGVQNGAALDHRSTFSRKADPKAYAFLSFSAIEGSGADVTWQYYAPDGSIGREQGFVIHDAHGLWAVWDSLPLSTAALGTWRVRALFEGAPIGEATFEVTE